MDQTLKLNEHKWGEIRHLIFRNIFILINIVIFSVVVLLISFGSIKEGIFLGIIVFINTTLAIIQDVHSWATLEKLQLLTALRVVRINEDGTESLVLSEEIKKDDKIKLRFGDQIPCDGSLIFSHSLEVNEGIITGESKSFSKSIGETVLAGSVVTSGDGILQSKTTYEESRIAKMTKNIKRYTSNISPIQASINTIIKYSGYVLLIVIPFVIYRGIVFDEPGFKIVQSIGALASTIVPQGLVIVATLLFAYGAISSYKRHVLLQDMNATEKLGRIKNLCMDKTGTLTENKLTVENIYTPQSVLRKESLELSTAYVDRSGDTSETIFAIKKFLDRNYDGETAQVLPFSSSRRFGGVLLLGKYAETVVLTGAPEIFIEHLTLSEEREWLENLVKTKASMGRRIICLVRYKGTELLRDLSGLKFSIVAVFVLHNNLRDGITEAINFFQKRGVRMRIISGDNPETVRAIALLAGVNNCQEAVTGRDMEGWDRDEFYEKVKNCNIFARIKPEQKERIIEALKKDGFTAMVGDGANDALAIKKADLGIAMFDGAGATRKLASVVLTNNSFSELPAGVKLADNVIENMEIFASIFLNQSFLGFLLLIFVSLFGFTYPFTPLNITFINYFTVGIPSLLIFYWSINPREITNIVRADTFFKRVIPFSFISSLIQILIVAVVFILTIKYLGNTQMNTPIALTFITVGTVFYWFSQSIHNNGHTPRPRKFQFLFLVTFEAVLLFFVFKISFFINFFNIAPPTLIIVIMAITVAFFYTFIQYEITKPFLKKGK